MVATLKQRITADFFQIALLLALLGGEYYLSPQNHRLNTDYYGNYVNEANSTEDILSISFGNHHHLNTIQNYYDHPAPDLPGKTIRNVYDSDVYNSTEDFDYFGDDDYRRHEIIIQELRRLSAPRSRFNNIIDLKAVPSYHDITAYLLNNTSNGGGNLNAPAITIAALPEVPPFSASSSSSRSGIPSRTSHLVPLSIISDDGHEVVLDRSPESEDEDVALGLYYPETQNKMELLGAGSLNRFDDVSRPRPPSPSPNLDFERFSILDLDLDYLEEQMNIELQNERQNPSNSGGDEEEEVQGAAALPPSSINNDEWSSSTFLWEQPLDFDQNLDLDMDMDELPLPMEGLFQTFRDISDEELMNTISPYDIHTNLEMPSTSTSSSNNNNRTGTKPGSVLNGTVLEKPAETTTTQKRRRRSTDSGSSSHDEVASSGHSSGDNETTPVSSSRDGRTGTPLVFDEYWETDSGIFDFDLLEDSSSPNHLSPEGPSIDLNLLDLDSPHTETDLGTVSPAFDGESIVDDWSEDRTSNSVEMIQTAPMHSGPRPSSHPIQPRYHQVHARMPPGFLRGGSMEQRWQELAGLLSLPSQHDPNGGPLAPSLHHHQFGPHHHHHHLHHHPSSLHHHHALHHASFAPTGPTATPYTADNARSVLLQNATLPTAELNATYGNVSMGPPPNLGSAVASSMHITNSSDPLTDPSAHYKMIESSHDMLYYQNSTNGELNNQTTEGFLSSILNDDDLQLMDMAMNEGMYTMRPMDNGGSGALPNGAAGPANLPLEANCTLGATGANVNVTSEDRMEASSDSAVSSMGSERVPPMTDPPMSDDWSESDHHGPSYSLDYSSGKLRGYDYYGKGESSHRVVVPVAQKKHHMFGKRFQQEQGNPLHPHPYSLSHPSADLPLPYPSASGLDHPSGNSSLEPLEMKYSCSLDFARHHNDLRIGGAAGSGGVVHTNHTYSIPASHPDNPHHLSSRPSRGQPKEKQSKSAKDYKSEEHLSRDEKRARTMGLPMSTDEIINLPMDEFNERLSKYDLTETQLSLIRDIRRRGKNKVAAQNCRKRKLDQITQLAEEVQKIRDRKQNLMREQDNLLGRRNALKDKYSLLYRHVFQALKDPEGGPYSPYEYSLQQAADGSIILVPRNPTQGSSSDSLDSTPSSSRRSKSKDHDMKKGGGV